MLIQMDGRRLGDQAPPFTLLIAVDDATGQVVSACSVSMKTLAATSC